MKRGTDDAVVVRFSRFRQELQKSTDVGEIHLLRDKAQALRTLVRRQGACYDVLFDLAKFKLDAERRAGQLLLAMEKAGGEANLMRGKEPPPGSDAPLLAELGISKYDSSRWQHEALVPEDQYQDWLSSFREDRQEPTSIALVKHSRDIQGTPRKIRVAKPTMGELVRKALQECSCRELKDGSCWLAQRLEEIIDA